MADPPLEADGGSNKEDLVRKMVAMGFEHHQVHRACEAAFFHPERSFEYLFEGIPADVQAKPSPSPATPENPKPSSGSSKTLEALTATPSSVLPARGTKKNQTFKDQFLNDVQHSYSKFGDDSSPLGYPVPTKLSDNHANNKTDEPLSPENIGMIDTTGQDGISPPKVHSSKVKESAANPPNQSDLPHVQSELEMGKILPLKDGDQEVHLLDTDFDRISSLLCQANREEWSFRPRTYAVLRMINAVDLMDDFVQLNCLDIALPYSGSNLPRSLSPERRDLFLRMQGSVLTKAASIEGRLTTHANFADNADNHLEPLNKLGDGGSGTVDRVRSKLSRKIYVRKRLNRQKTFEESTKALKFFKREVDALKRLKHRHLVRYVGSYTDPQFVGIIMEPVADSDLRVFLNQKSFHPAEYDCIREAFGCLCTAIMYLQEKKIRHKDIKPENILVKQRKVYITDFGIARDWLAQVKSTTTGEIGPISMAYAAPEVVAKEPRSTSADIWSLGCVYLDMIVSH